MTSRLNAGCFGAVEWGMNVFPPGRILVPLDFSRRSRAAWAYAAALAKRFACELEAVHVANFFQSHGDLIHVPMKDSELSELRSRLRREAPEATAIHVVEGAVAKGVLETAERRRVDLIVTATEGLTGLERLRLGSAAEEIVRRSRVPVLALHGRTKLPSSILAPVNMKAYSQEGAKYARLVSKAMKADLTAYHVREPGSALRAKPRGLKTAEGDPVARILEEAERHDLVVLVAHRKGLFRDAILGTTAEQVLRRSPVPTLCVPPAEPVSPGGRPGRSRARGKLRLAAGRSMLR